MAEGTGGVALTLTAIQDIFVKEIQKLGDVWKVFKQGIIAAVESVETDG